MKILITSMSKYGRWSYGWVQWQQILGFEEAFQFKAGITADARKPNDQKQTVAFVKTVHVALELCKGSSLSGRVGGKTSCGQYTWQTAN